MATYSKQLLSGGTNGKNIKVAATATAGTTIHTAVAGTTDIDEIVDNCQLIVTCTASDSPLIKSLNKYIEKETALY